MTSISYNSKPKISDSLKTEERALKE